MHLTKPTVSTERSTVRQTGVNPAMSNKNRGQLSIACSFLAAIGMAVGWSQLQNSKDHQPASSRFLTAPAPAFATVLDSPIQPIFLEAPLDPEKVVLGEKLFHDPRLSSNNSISCASCHDLNRGGVDRLPKSVGINGNLTPTNSPTVFNVSLNSTQFWDGRVETLHQQVDGPILDPTEMGSNWPDIIDKLAADDAYLSSFHTLYAEGINEVTIKDALVSFEQSLLTVNSPFDRYLQGDAQAISDSALKGYEKFKEYGCIACHQGRNVGGNMYQAFGVMGDYFADRGTEIEPADLGRYNVTGLEEDKYVFRVPSLRLAPLTAPYFHDGSAKTLKEAVRVMIKYQIGRTTTEQDENQIIDFIHSLVGEYDGKRLTP